VNTFTSVLLLRLYWQQLSLNPFGGQLLYMISFA
jgi:hypothetical protein